MFEQIKRFMMQEDRNGTWNECTEAEMSYVYETLNDWIDDGLEETPRVRTYMEWLRTELSGGLW